MISFKANTYYWNALGTIALILATTGCARNLNNSENLALIKRPIFSAIISPNSRWGSVGEIYIQSENECSNWETQTAQTNVLQSVSGVAQNIYRLDSYDQNTQTGVPVLVKSFTSPNDTQGIRNMLWNENRISIPSDLPDGVYFSVYCDANQITGCSSFPFSPGNSSSLQGRIGQRGENPRLQSLFLKSGNSVRSVAAWNFAIDVPRFQILLGPNPDPSVSPTLPSFSTNTNNNEPDGPSGNEPSGNESDPDGTRRHLEDYCHFTHSPLFIDLGQNGIELSSQEKGILFDVTGDGVADSISWVTNADDVALVLDKNHNGQIDGIHELFGNNTIGPDGHTADNGFETLEKYDFNHDRRINSSDPIFAFLQIWSDENRNGMSEEGELKTLLSLGIESIDLNYVQMNEIDGYGNQTNQRSVVKMADGTARLIFDIWFRIRSN